MSELRVLVGGLVFPEAPRWRGGKIWFSDIHDFRIKTCDAQGRIETVVAMPEGTRSSGLGFLPDGRLLIVSSISREIFRLDADGLKLHCDLTPYVAHNPNDMVVDGRGNAYVGNLGYDFRDPAAMPALAELVLVRPDGTAQVVVDKMAFPNGAVITPDGKTLIVGETMAARFSAFDIRPDGTLANRRIWALFDERGFTAEGRSERIRPDGCCLDAEGAIWFASPGRNLVYRVKQGGEFTHILKPSRFPFACMLGGHERKTLYVCSAPTHVTPDVINLRDGRLEVMDVDVPGVGIP